METVPLSPQVVVVVFDATKDHTVHEFGLTINRIRKRGGIVLRGDTLLVLGVLNKVQHPMGYQLKACTDSVFGTNARAMEDEVSKKVDMYESMLQQSAEECEEDGVSIKVKITAGTPIRMVVLQEVIFSEATWVILDRDLQKDSRFYIKQIPCKVASVHDSFSVEVLKLQTSNEAVVLEQKSFYSLCRPVQRLSVQDRMQESNFPGHDDTGSSTKQERLGKYSIVGSEIIPRQHDKYLNEISSPIVCAGCGTRTVIYIKETMRFTFSEIQAATSDFSKENLLGEGGFGDVYRGQLKDGLVIAAKVRKEASSQGYTEFHSELYALSLARHRNIVMLLGHCSKDNRNILVYEYICNKSLEWHLFSKSESMLEWDKRHAIAIGTAKGLRFLHEECRGGPIIHRDMRPSNILLTHDFIPMLGDFGLAKWKINNDSVHTRILGTLGYLAPEYAENGIVSVRTDVYAFGMVLLQLTSGRKVVDAKSGGEHQSLRQWAEPLIQKRALHELIDPRIEYDIYELYRMAKAAYFCLRRSPNERPSMGEVVRLLEGENDSIYELEEQFLSNYEKGGANS